jgi:hypothetical protein
MRVEGCELHNAFIARNLYQEPTRRGTHKASRSSLQSRMSSCTQ